jgi:hypothetical protein
MSVELSIIICTHNPRADYMERVLEAVDRQTLDRSRYEVLLVDNGSRVRLEEEPWVRSRPWLKVLREENLGLSHARLCGIRASTGELLVFVDDDNVLSPDYLERAVGISKEYRWLGAWGCAQCLPEFEVEPNPELKPYLVLLTLGWGERAVWSNFNHPNPTVPGGAGMCIRREVAVAYVKKCERNPLQLRLGRNGERLLFFEDTEMALTATELGYGTGLFPELVLKHLMRAGKEKKEYLLKLQETTQFSEVLFRFARGQGLRGTTSWLIGELKELVKLVWADRIHRQFILRAMKGRFLGRRELLRWRSKR